MSQILRPEMDSQNSTTSLKRKASELPATTNKKAKDEGVNTPSVSTAQAEVALKQPTNVTLPVLISFPPPTPDTVKIASWNVAGLRAALKKVKTCSCSLAELSMTDLFGIPTRDSSFTSRRKTQTS